MLARLRMEQIDAHLQAKIDPADVVRQALSTAHVSRDQFHGKTNAEQLAWLRRTLATTLAQELRRLGIGKRDANLEQSLNDALDNLSRSLEAWLGTGRASPYHKAFNQLDVLNLSDALEELPDDQRRAVELRHLQRWTLNSIGDRMGRTTNSVAGLLRRGLKSLRERLSETSG